MAAYKYSYGGMDSLFKNSADVAGAVCQKLSESDVGLTAKSLVDASRDEKAPLHNEFEWNDSIAAEKYREEQAANIIRHLIIVRTDTEEVRASKDRSFVFTGERKTGYVPLDKALSNEVWKTNLLKAARADMRTFVLKYNRLSELAGIINKMKGFLGEEAS